MLGVSNSFDFKLDDVKWILYKFIVDLGNNVVFDCVINYEEIMIIGYECSVNFILIVEELVNFNLFEMVG